MLPLVFAAEAGTLELLDRTGADVRAGSGAQGTEFDAITAATARAMLTDRRWSLLVGYSPTFSVQNTDNAPPTAYVLQAESVDFTWHDRRLSLSLEESGLYGWQNTTNLIPQPGALTQSQPIQTLPGTMTTLQRVMVSSTLTLEYHATRRWTWDLLAGYSVGGGARDVDRAVNPLCTPRRRRPPLRTR